MKKRNDKAAYVPKWIPIKKAARLMNRNYGHVRKLAKGWAKSGLAELRRIPGQKSSYFVRSDAHPDLLGHGTTTGKRVHDIPISELRAICLRGVIVERLEMMNLAELVDAFLHLRK
jgi:hypothetical protein